MDPHPNFAYTTIATPPSPALSGTSLIVAAGTGARFAWSGGAFNATICPAGQRPTPSNAEIVRVTLVAADTFSITRTQEGTVARAILAGDQIFVAVTQKVLTDIENRSFITVDAEAQLTASRRLVAGANVVLNTATPGEISIATAGGGGNVTDTGAEGSEPVGAVDGDLYFPNNAPYLYRYNGLIWVPWGPIWPMAAPILADFAWINQGAAAAVNTNGGIYMSAVGTGADNIKILKRAAPATPYTITVGFIPEFIDANYQFVGMVFRESSTGRLQSCSVGYANGLEVGSAKFTNPTTFSAGYVSILQSTRTQWFKGPMQWLRLGDDGTNRKCWMSANGFSWVEIHSIGRTDFLTADEVGIAVSVNHASAAIGGHFLSWVQG